MKYYKILKPCPRCGCEHLRVTHWKTMGFTTKFAIDCYDCNYEIEGKSKRRVLNKWGINKPQSARGNRHKIIEWGNHENFDIKKLLEAVEKVRCATHAPEIDVLCSPGLVNEIEEHLLKNKPIRFKIHPLSKKYSTCFEYNEDMVYVIPSEGLEKPSEEWTNNENA